MKKAALVAGGYALAVVLASAVVAVHSSSLDLSPAEASGGMHAFGDALLFLGVFGVASLPATGAALYFLRAYQGFWAALALLGLAVATTGVLCAVLYLAGRGIASPSPLAVAAAFSVLRILVAPLLALSFLLAAVLSPHRGPKLSLLAATAMEAGVTAFAVLIWFLPNAHTG